MTEALTKNKPAKGMTLVDIGEDFLALDQLWEEAGGEITPEIEEWCREMEANLAAKADGYAAFWRLLENRVRVCGEEVERIKARSDTQVKKLTLLKFSILGFMLSRGQKKIETATNTISVSANGGSQPVSIPDPLALPAEYLVTKTKVTTEPDMDRIRVDLLDGKEIRGAQLMPRGHHLRLR